MTLKKRSNAGLTGRASPTPSSARRPHQAPSERREENTAWRRLQASLALCLLDLGKAEYLIISYVGANYYVQFAGLGRRGLLAEAACNTYIEPPNAVLTESQYAKSLSLGWQPATDQPPELLPKGVRPRGAPNFFVRVGAATSYAPLARLAVKTFREVYRIPHTSELTYEAFERDGPSIRFPSLGLTRRSAARGAPETGPSPPSSEIARKPATTESRTGRNPKQERRRRADDLTTTSPAPRIRWIKCEGGIGNGHGVEFHYEDIESGPIAFIVGYDWLHKPGKGAVRTEILKARPPSGVIGMGAWKEVRSEVKVAVGRFLAGHQHFLSGDKLGKVSLWFNA